MSHKGVSAHGGFLIPSSFKDEIDKALAFWIRVDEIGFVHASLERFHRDHPTPWSKVLGVVRLIRKRKIMWRHLSNYLKEDG